MDPRLRVALGAVAVVQALFAAALFWQVPAVLGAWPFPGTSPLSATLLASLLAAAAASTGWAVWADRERALAGIAWDYIANFGFMLAIGAWKVATGDGGLLPFTVASVGGLAFGIGLYRRVRHVPWVDERRMPRIVRVSFGIFVAALAAVGLALIAGIPNLLPWTVTTDLSVVFGAMLLSAGAYFVYGLRHPVMDNAYGQLVGFLAYDLVLLVPLATRLPGVDPAFALGLALYLAVILYSAVLATWFLFVNPASRLARRR
ncbi:MAG TPA: hypothetical protein VFY23_02490 [Candidatus Limnocylindrales bacterium]|nr:hypothetical protein [Candidatus Limnocylindrales bacterium]